VRPDFDEEMTPTPSLMLLGEEVHLGDVIHEIYVLGDTKNCMPFVYSGNRDGTYLFISLDRDNVPNMVKTLEWFEGRECHRGPDCEKALEELSE
jgi:hypothetical protein